MLVAIAKAAEVKQQIVPSAVAKVGPIVISMVMVVLVVVLLVVLELVVVS